jgi:hypothetical protein
MLGLWLELVLAELHCGAGMHALPVCTEKALIHGRICPPQCTGIKYDIRT